MASEQSEPSTSSKKTYSTSRGKYCCIPKCNNYQRKDGKQVGLSFFQIPKTDPGHSKWVNAIKHYRRKGSGDTFDLENHTYYACEEHF